MVPKNNYFCKIDKCWKRKERREMCQMHWWRLTHHGDIFWNSKIIGCRVENCDRSHKAKGLCELHYSRLRTTGTLSDPIYPVLDKKRYIQRKFKNHPLSNKKTGRAFVHRINLYNSINGSNLPCFWCGKHLEWFLKGIGDRLFVDHVDHDKHNNNLTNLVPSCNKCNTTRTRKNYKKYPFFTSIYSGVV